MNVKESLLKFSTANNIVADKVIVVTDSSVNSWKVCLPTPNASGHNSN